MIKAEEIAEAVDFLLKENEGCYFKPLVIDNGNNKWGIVIGWGAGFDKKEKTPFSDGQYRICSKIAYNNSALQCDYEWDFKQPCDRFTGEVYDTDTELSPDFNAEALRLSKEFERVVKSFFDL